MLNHLRRLSARFNRQSDDPLERDASLVLDVLVEDMQYSPSKAVKVALQAYGVQQNIVNTDTTPWEMMDEERIARRIVEMLGEYKILQQPETQPIQEPLKPKKFGAFK